MRVQTKWHLPGTPEDDNGRLSRFTTVSTTTPSSETRRVIKSTFIDRFNWVPFNPGSKIFVSVHYEDVHKQFISYESETPSVGVSQKHGVTFIGPGLYNPPRCMRSGMTGTCHI